MLLALWDGHRIVRGFIVSNLGGEQGVCVDVNCVL